MVTKNSTTITLTGEEQTVQFDRSYPYFWVQNLGDSDVLISVDGGIVDGADGVITVPAGASCGTMHNYTANADRLYLLGSGKVQVMGTGSAFNPFNLARRGGDVGKTVNGSSAYTLENAVDYPIMELKLYGKSTQDGTPTPDASVDIVSVGDSGTVNITSNNGGNISVTAAITSALPLCGIPVTSNGNYTDSTGQQWIADELIYNADGSGNVVKRTFRYTFNGDETIIGYSPKTGTFLAQCSEKLINAKIVDNGVVSNIICSHLDRLSADSQYINVDTKNSISINKTGIVYINIVGLASAAEYKTKLKEFYDNGNPLTVIYELAAPQEIELTAAEMTALSQLQMFNGITNIFNDDGAEMSVKYCTNGVLSEYVFPVVSGLQKQINDLNAAILSMGSDV